MTALSTLLGAVEYDHDAATECILDGSTGDAVDYIASARARLQLDRMPSHALYALAKDLERMGDEALRRELHASLGVATCTACERRPATDEDMCAGCYDSAGERDDERYAP